MGNPRSFHLLEVPCARYAKGIFWGPDAITGDIILVLQPKEHPKFKRKFDDLYVDQTLSLTEALCGFQFSLTHLDGRQLLVRSNSGEVVKPGQSKAINDEGMPHHQRLFIRGRLYIHFDVEFPDSVTLSADQRRTLEMILPLRSSKQLSKMELNECEETTLYDVDIEEEMRRKQNSRKPMARMMTSQAHQGYSWVQCAQR